MGGSVKTGGELIRIQLRWLWGGIAIEHFRYLVLQWPEFTASLLLLGVVLVYGDVDS